jgi:type IV pilus assembly protein PilM
VNSILSKTKFGSRSGARPPAAVEISLEGVVAAVPPKLGQPQPDYHFEPLPAGALLPGVGEPNLRAPEAVANAIRVALVAVAPRTRAVTLVVPDAVVRVFVLDFEAFPAKPAEALPVLRFRLRKMLPFDVEHAGVSYQLLVEKKNEVKVLVAVLPGPILAQYESAVREAGYEPGAILPSSLAALAAIESTEPALMANLIGPSLTTVIASGDDLLLYRNVELSSEPAPRLEEVRRGIAVATAYFEDKLLARPKLLYNAGEDFEMMGLVVQSGLWIDDPELKVVGMGPASAPLSKPPWAAGYASLAATTGALAGVR